MRLSFASTTPTLLSARKKMPPGLENRVSLATACCWAALRVWICDVSTTPMMRAADCPLVNGGAKTKTRLRFCGAPESASET